MSKLPAIILSSLFSLPSLASILPEHSKTIPVSLKNNSGLSEDEYHQVISKVETVYRPVIEKMGKELTINRLWHDGQINAGTYQKGNEWIINLYGGYARHPYVTADAFALVICHELGHHLGGAPRKIFNDGNPGWPSTEGQADYFATLKCLRKVFRHDDNEKIIQKQKVSEYISHRCRRNFPTSWEGALCIRTTLAGVAVAKISADVLGLRLPTVTRPEKFVVEKTYDEHPTPQCRLDTYFQGSICEVSSYVSLSATDEKKGTCHPQDGHKEGSRPFCWYSPQ